MGTAAAAGFSRLSGRRGGSFIARSARGEHGWPMQGQVK
jgi:hypothetical protein